MKAVIGGLVSIGAILVGGLAFSTLPRDRTIASFCTSLSGRSHSQRHNSLLALGRLVSVTIKPGATFSFNKVVGTFSQDQGYRKAPVSYNGQLISDWGGGVCQTSTTLYNAALLAGMQIVERHRHRFLPSYILPGRDAAVAYSNIDLSFKNPYPFPVQISGYADGNNLLISFIASNDLAKRPQIISEVRKQSGYQTIEIGSESGHAHVSNSGKEGIEVAIYRVTGDEKELISMDSYPAMSRVVQFH